MKVNKRCEKVRRVTCEGLLILVNKHVLKEQANMLYQYIQLYRHVLLCKHVILSNILCFRSNALRDAPGIASEEALILPRGNLIHITISSRRYRRKQWSGQELRWMHLIGWSGWAMAWMTFSDMLTGLR